MATKYFLDRVGLQRFAARFLTKVDVRIDDAINIKKSPTITPGSTDATIPTSKATFDFVQAMIGGGGGPHPGANIVVLDVGEPAPLPMPNTLYMRPLNNDAYSLYYSRDSEPPKFLGKTVGQIDSNGVNVDEYLKLNDCVPIPITDIEMIVNEEFI